MTLDRARLIFKTHMAAARSGKKLTAYDKEQFHKAQAVLRQHRKPAMNSPKRKAPRLRNSAKPVLIYQQVDRIYATKRQSHICDSECKKNGHRYFHDFTSKPRMYGLPNGDLLITTNKF